MIQWIAVYTKPRQEKVVLDQLTKKGIEAYLPILRQKRRWSDRMKWVDMPLFNSYIFVQIELKNRIYVLETQGVHHIIKFQNKIAVIPEMQIKAIQQMLEGGFEPTNTDYFVIGDAVEIVGGPMNKIKGIVSRIDGEDKFVIKIDAIQHAVAVHVDRRYLKQSK
ncbi:MAG: UpxY family transcription antiterminator [Candidatus Marinimicrobia bacterium]|nr:UpxY family transcription antiterminator [Candidatus Neomarinimicrobiota bacterium]